jgi:hypothetical protein
MGLAEAVADVLAKFRTATINGKPVRVFDDSAKIAPPCIWLPVPNVEFHYGKRVLIVEWQAYLVAPNQSTESVSATLSALVDAVTGLFPFTGGTPYPLTLQGGGQPVPSYQLVWSARIPIGDITP